MDNKYYLEKTKLYYAKWLSIDPDILDQQSGEYFFYSEQRNWIPDGYDHSFDLFGYFSDQLKVLTYGKKFEPHVGYLKGLINKSNDISELSDLMKEKFDTLYAHDLKYYFVKLPSNIDYSLAKQLTIQDYPAFLSFFTQQYTDSKPESWLKEYFDTLTNKGYVFGYFIGENLVSVTDAPNMPYFQNDLVDIGINTLIGYRGKGYAKIVLGAMIRFLVRKSLVPIVSCASSNKASQKVIESLGFTKLADVISVTI